MQPRNAVPVLLKGLFDRPMHVVKLNDPVEGGGGGGEPIEPDPGEGGGGEPPPEPPEPPTDPIPSDPITIPGNPFQPTGPPTEPTQPTEPGNSFCPPGYMQDIFGDCIAVGAPPIIITAPPILYPPGTGGVPPIPTSPGDGGSTSTSTTGGEDDNITVNNTVNVTDQGVAQVADAVKQGISAAAQDAANIAQDAAQKITDAVGGLASKVVSGIQSALGNIASVITKIATSVWTVIKDVFANIGTFLGDLISKIYNNIGPVLAAIAGVLDKINAYVQMINDTLLKPLINLYNGTIGTIATLTTAIERDLHEGLKGILDIPNQIALGLGSLDATLDRTVQQLGITNVENIKTGITFAGESLPKPFGAAMAQALGGDISKGKLTTTFGGAVSLSSESLQQVSAEAISGLGTLLKEMLGIIVNTFSSTLSDVQKGWDGAESIFVGLLDGVLSLLTTVTAMGALASPLIDAAEQQARTLVPTRKLDASTVIEALKRNFMSVQDAFKEIQTAGIDATRFQILQDLSVFLADVDMALEWWYRGIITDDDLKANMVAHGITDSDQEAIKEGSIFKPSIQELLRWKDFGIQTEDEFKANCKILRYDDAQIQAVLDSYQDRIQPNVRAQMDGVLNNTGIGWFNQTALIAPPADLLSAGQLAGMHPEAIQLLWLQHWNVPSVETFIQLYFRGIRTLTELEARMGMANIPKELYMDLIQSQTALIPYRSIPSFVKAGYMTLEQASNELGAHGFDLAHQNIILKAVTPKASTTAGTTATTIHTLSVQNARALWGEGGITDQQYEDILVAHGYTLDLAKLQVAADAITEHIKQQKQVLADYTIQVESGLISLDDATSELTKQGFTPQQVLNFQAKVGKSLKVNQKHPTLPQLNQFLKAQLITLDQYASELVAQGWVDPWLSALIGLVSSGGVPATEGA